MVAGNGDPHQKLPGYSQLFSPVSWHCSIAQIKTKKKAEKALGNPTCSVPISAKLPILKLSRAVAAPPAGTASAPKI